MSVVYKSATDAVLEKACYEVIDATGRKIVLQEPDFLSEFELLNNLGDTVSESWMRAVSPLRFIKSVDGIDTNPFVSKGVIDALLKRLDSAGYAAVIKGLQEHFNAGKPGEQSEQRDREIAQVKK